MQGSAIAGGSIAESATDHPYWLTAVGRSLSIEIKPFRVTRREDFGPAFSTVRQAHAEALYVLENAFYVAERGTLLKLAFQDRLPVIYGEKAMAEDGALMSYGANFEDMWRRSAAYVDKILRGAQPADLPIEQPRELLLVINLKTAKALGIAIPESILLRADQVIR